jgi:hypothetical protein
MRDAIFHARSALAGLVLLGTGASGCDSFHGDFVKDLGDSCPRAVANQTCWDFSRGYSTYDLTSSGWQLDSCWVLRGGSLQTMQFPVTATGMDATCSAVLPFTSIADHPTGRIVVNIQQASNIVGLKNYAVILLDDSGDMGQQVLLQTVSGILLGDVQTPALHAPTGPFRIHLQLQVGAGATLPAAVWQIQRIEILGE